jgi:hypothetical protein
MQTKFCGVAAPYLTRRALLFENWKGLRAFRCVTTVVRGNLRMPSYVLFDYYESQYQPWRILHALCCAGLQAPPVDHRYRLVIAGRYH